MTNSKRSLGMMSGTSIDGYVSAAIIETDGVDIVKRIATAEYCYEKQDGLRAIHHLTKAAELAYRQAAGDHAAAAKCFPLSVREYLKATFAIDDAQAEEKLYELESAFGTNQRRVTISDVIQRSTQVHGRAARHLLDSISTTAADIDFVGYHGQTLYHDPFFNRVTVQVGEAQALADELKVPVVFDFRTNDVVHGGQGAPLAPAYHRALVLCAGIDTAAILNLGGTANVTVVSSSIEDMLGFDTGPANGLIDRYVKERAGIALDKDSNLANQGTVSDAALASLMKHAIQLKDGRNFLEIPPPKSLDIRDYTFNTPEFQALPLNDGCATLNAFTAECVGMGTEWIKRAGYSIPSRWVLCGGGAHSPHLCSQLIQRLDRRVPGGVTLVSADEVGWSTQGMEAELFAYLAVRSARGLPLTFPGTTGVRRPVTGGRVFLPR